MASATVFLSLMKPQIKLAKCLVPTARLELAQLSPLPPQDSVSTNFTTSALLPPAKVADGPNNIIDAAPAGPGNPVLTPNYLGISIAFESVGTVVGATGAAGCDTGADVAFTLSITLPVACGRFVAM